MMRQQLMHPPHRMTRDTAQHIAQPQLGVDIVSLTRCQERVEHRCTLRCLVRAGEKVVLAAQSYRTNRVLDQVVVDLNTTVLYITKELIPAIEAVSDGFAPRTLRLPGVGLQPLLELFQYR